MNKPKTEEGEKKFPKSDSQKKMEAWKEYVKSQEKLDTISRK